MSEVSPASVVLLGRSGFFARALAERLRATHSGRLHVLGSADLDLTSPDASHRLQRFVEEQTILIVAARATRGLDPFRTFTDDIAIAANIARCVAVSRLRRCVYFSSAAVYGDGVSNLAITEQTPLVPNSLYGSAKVAVEGLLRHAAERTGTPLLILRPCMVYGPGDTSDAYGPGRLLRSAMGEGKVRMFGDGCEVRAYLFVRDLVDITLALAFGGAAGIFNLASGQSHSFRQLLTCIRDIVGRPFEVVTAPRDRLRTDQAFNPVRLLAAIPDLKFTPLERGLSKTYAAYETSVGDS